jgi:SAM-dependent methyltransferase
MARTPHQAAFDRVQRVMVSMAARHPGTRRVMARTGRVLTEAADRGSALAEARAAGVADTYGASYFGEGRDASGDRAGLSGYARYDRIASNADIAGWLLWRNFRVGNGLDVGCATGFLVEVLRELGIDAAGCDLSAYAVDHATPGAAGHIRVASLCAGLPWPDGHFELVTALETLEHLPPERVPVALRELRRVCGAYLYATIPSFGRNVSGPDGHFEGKVRPEVVADYVARGPAYAGPVPKEDLAVDAEGHPVEGHLTIASFDWWTDRFGEAGFTRCPAVERRLYADIEPADLAPFWNLYVFRVPGASDEVTEPRHPARTLAELGLQHPLFEAEPSR